MTLSRDSAASDTSDIFITGAAGRLAVRCKGLAAKPGQVVILVQGANITGQLGYDLKVEGGADYSFMDALVARGLGAVTFSVRGYGASDMPPNPLDVDTDAAIEDLDAVMRWLATQGYKRPHLLGWSWGGRITGRFAEAQGARLDRLVMLDPALGGGNKIPFDPPSPVWRNTAAYFMDRLEDEFMELAARESLSRQAEATELVAPNGIRLENSIGSIRPRADLIGNPTLMLYGHAAGQQNYMQGGVTRTEFFETLKTRDKALVIVSGGGDYAHIQNPRRTIHKIVADFLLS